MYISKRFLPIVCFTILLIESGLVGAEVLPGITIKPTETVKESVVVQAKKPQAPVDEYNRGTPRSSIKGFFRLMANLGIGGFALALVAQDMLKNLLGSIMILLDRPYEIGQRIVAKGQDGVVEEIGLRSTRIRLLNGHQVTIPNEEMAKIDIENIGRRPYIRRSTNISIPLHTPVEKVSEALAIVQSCLQNHEHMNAAYPARVFFDEF